MSETSKNKGGRPAINATPITVRVEPFLLSEIDLFKKRTGVSRPEAIRELVRIALSTKETH